MVKIIVLSIVICVLYCIFDRKRQNTKTEIKVLSDRISDTDKQATFLAEAVGRNVKRLERVESYLKGLYPDFEDVEPHYTGQSFDPND